MKNTCEKIYNITRIAIIIFICCYISYVYIHIQNEQFKIKNEIKINKNLRKQIHSLFIKYKNAE